MNKIQRTSRYLRWTFTTLMALTPLLYIASWCFFPGMEKKDSFIFGFDMIPAGIIIQHPLTTMMRLIGLTISLLPMTVNLLLYSNLVTLFLMYERLSYFTMENVAIIKKIGFYLLLGELIRPFIEAVSQSS